MLKCMGVPLLNSKKEIIGLIAALYEQPLKDKEDIITLFEHIKKICHLSKNGIHFYKFISFR